MKKRIVFLILAALLILATSCLMWHTHFNGKKQVTVYGNVDVRQVDLAFRVSGRVTDLMFEEGALVEPGQLMARMEKKPYSDTVLEVQAKIKSTEASLENAEKILKRRQELIGTGSVSQEDLDDAKTAYDVYTEQLKEYKASLAIAQKNLFDTDIYAPTRGTILTRIREPGSVVNPSDPVYTLSISSPVWIRAFIPEPNVGLIYPGMRGEVHTDTPGGKVYTGYVGFISPVSEFTPKFVETTQLRTDLVYRIRLYVDNPDYGLRQGQPVTVVLPLPVQEPMTDGK